MRVLLHEFFAQSLAWQFAQQYDRSQLTQLQVREYRQLTTLQGLHQKLHLGMQAFHDLHLPPLPTDGKCCSHLFYDQFPHVNVLLLSLCLRRISFSSQQQEPVQAPQKLPHDLHLFRY